MSWLIRVAYDSCEQVYLPDEIIDPNGNDTVAVPVTCTEFIGVPPSVNR